MGRLVLVLIEVLLLILNIVAMLFNYKQGNYKSACFNAGAIGVIGSYLLYLIVEGIND